MQYRHAGLCCALALAICTTGCKKEEKDNKAALIEAAKAAAKNVKSRPVGSLTVDDGKKQINAARWEVANCDDGTTVSVGSEFATGWECLARRGQMLALIEHVKAKRAIKEDEAPAANNWLAVKHDGDAYLAVRIFNDLVAKKLRAKLLEATDIEAAALLAVLQAQGFRPAGPCGVCEVDEASAAWCCTFQDVNRSGTAKVMAFEGGERAKEEAEDEPHVEAKGSRAVEVKIYEPGAPKQLLDELLFQAS